MRKLNLIPILSTAAGAALLFGTVGCRDLPGTPGQQGATIGGLGGAATGAVVGGHHHRLLGALLGGAVGAGGGSLIGANSDRITHHDSAAAENAARRAQARPATAQEALNAPTADLNGDGFVTMDEVAAMRQAGLTDQQMLDKLRATGQVFELTPQQQDYLRSNGVSQYIIDQMPQINREVRDRLMTNPPPPPQPNSGGVISEPPPAAPPPAPRY